MLLYVKGTENDEFYNRFDSSNFFLLNGALTTIFSVRTPFCAFLVCIGSWAWNILDGGTRLVL